MKHNISFLCRFLINNILVFVLYLFLTISNTLAQPIKTNIFVLNTANPLHSDSAFYKLNGLNDRGKLELPSKNLSVLKIENINPLRYFYFINNQLVTQFMEASPSIYGRTVTQGTPITPTNINFLKLFKAQSSSVVDTSAVLLNQITSLADSLSSRKARFSTISVKYSNLLYYKELLDTSRYKIKAKTSDTIGLAKAAEEYLNISNLLNSESSQLGKKLNDYKDLIDQRISRIKGSGVLDIFEENYMEEINAHDTGYLNVIYTQAKSVSQFKTKLYTLIADRKKALLLLQKIQYSTKLYAQPLKYSDVRNPGSDFSDLKTVVYGFDIILDESKLTLDTSASNDVSIVAANYIDKQLEVFRIARLLSESIFNFCDQFILKNTVEVGELLQQHVFTLSRYKNELQNLNAIEKNALDDIQTYRDQTKKIFIFFQKISSDLSVYANAIQTSGKSFQGYLSNIDSNYVAILDYLKIFDFVNKNNSVEYTLPLGSNMSNADFVRYTVSRLNKNTTATEEVAYDIWLNGGLKIDFSVGFFASGLVDNEYQKLFISHAAVSGTDSIQVHRIKSGGYNFAFGGMMNVTPRPGANWFYVGGSVGFIYSNNQKLQIATGISLHFGKTERIIVHAGFTVGTAKTFNDSQLQYKSNTIAKHDNWGFMVPSYNDYTIPSLIDKFTLRPFFGISYNLSKSSPFNAVSESGLTKYNSLLLNK